MKFHPATINQLDPLAKSDVASPSTQELFKKVSKVCDGFTPEQVADAAANLIINAVRQQYENRSGAERAFDNISGRAKNVLLERHYDGTGKRRNVFPFDQVVRILP